MTSRVGLLVACFVGLALTVFFFTNESRHTAELQKLRDELGQQSDKVTESTQTLRG